MPARAKTAPAPKIIPVPSIVFDGWLRARTRIADRPTNWTPEANLYADFVTYVRAIEPDCTPDADRFRAELIRTRQRRRKMLARPIGAVRESLVDCWDRTFLRALAMVA